MPITTDFVSSNLAHGEVLSIHYYVLKFVSNLLQVGAFPFANKTDHHDITEILLKVTLNSKTLTYPVPIQKAVWHVQVINISKKCIQIYDMPKTYIKQFGSYKSHFYFMICIR